MAIPAEAGHICHPVRLTCFFCNDLRMALSDDEQVRSERRLAITGERIWNVKEVKGTPVAFMLALEPS
jgi:hypothetical protein